MKLDQKSELERERVGGLLLSIRNAHQLSLREAANRAGLSFTYLSQIERGHKMPSRDAIANLARAYVVDEQVVLREAGYSEEPPTHIPPDRINWAFGTMCRDCNFRYGMQVWTKPLDLELKALLVEIYQEGTGRQLFTYAEEGAVQELLDSESSLDSDIENKACDAFDTWVQSVQEKCPELSPLEISRWLLWSLIQHNHKTWPEPFRGYNPQPDPWVVEETPLNFSDIDEKQTVPTDKPEQKEVPSRSTKRGKTGDVSDND